MDLGRRSKVLHFGFRAELEDNRKCVEMNFSGDDSSTKAKTGPSDPIDPTKSLFLSLSRIINILMAFAQENLAWEKTDMGCSPHFNMRRNGGQKTI